LCGVWGIRLTSAPVIMDKIESLDMRGLTLDERKDFLIWYESEFLNIKIKSEIEYEIYRTKLLS